MSEKSWCDFLAGWCGGVCGLVCGHPLDTIKVRQQTIPGNLTIWKLTRLTYCNEGIRGFYKGLSYPALMSGFYTSVLFGVYGNSLRALESFRGTPPRRMCCEGGPVGNYWHMDVFLAGCVGGTAVVLVSSPIELIKIKLQLQDGKRKVCDTQPNSKTLSIKERNYKGPLDAFVTIYKKYGIYRGIYKGLWSMLWRDVWTFGLYMVAYEHILCWFKEKEDRSSKTSLVSQIVAGGIAGILSWIVVMPLDVVKSRIQGDDFSNPKYKGIIHCLLSTYRAEGLRSLFLGTVLVTVRAFPANAAVFVGYEFIMRRCDPSCQRDWND